MEKIKKSLLECSLKFLDKTFGLEQVESLEMLNQWLVLDADINNFEMQFLQHLRQVLAFNVHDWNEYELDAHFIGPLFTLVNFSSTKFNHYSQRLISGIVGGYELTGKPDGMIATGRREPETPFFAFQEYKKELDPDGDPAGQVLAAMLVGQSYNKNPETPMYGCYVNGSQWKFIVLTNKHYAISNGFNTLDIKELSNVFKCLKTLKDIIKQRVFVNDSQ